MTAETVTCTNCGHVVRARETRARNPQPASFLDQFVTLRHLPVDARGWCLDCQFMEGVPEHVPTAEEIAEQVDARVRRRAA